MFRGCLGGVQGVFRGCSGGLRGFRGLSGFKGSRRFRGLSLGGELVGFLKSLWWG